MALDYKNLHRDDLKMLARNITTGIFSQVVVKLGYDHDELEHKFFFNEISEQEWNEKREIIDATYCKHLTKLSTECLELIIYAHKQKVMNRAQRTLDAITTELLERELHEKEGKDR